MFPMAKEQREISVNTSTILNQPDFVEQQLASGRITCAAMSRQLLADPEWPNKVASGQIKEIHRCVRCNKKCLGGLQQHQGTHCIYEKV